MLVDFSSLIRPRRSRSFLEFGSSDAMDMKNGAHSVSVFCWRDVV